MNAERTTAQARLAPPYFVLRVGFAVNEKASATQFLAGLQLKDSKWQGAEIREAHTNLPNPHNVPGTLGFMVLRRNLRNTVDVQNGIDQAVETLLQLEFRTVRVLVHHVYAVVRAGDPNRPDLCKAEHSFSVPRFPGVTRIPELPRVGAHIVFFETPDVEEPLTIREAESLVSAQRMMPDQIYRYIPSGLTEERGEQERVICTTYQISEDSVFQQTEETVRKLTKTAKDLGYDLYGILEHIIDAYNVHGRLNGAHEKGAFAIF
jgi:hypothetical protein